MKFSSEIVIASKHSIYKDIMIVAILIGNCGVEGSRGKHVLVWCIGR